MTKTLITGIVLIGMIFVLPSRIHAIDEAEVLEASKETLLLMPEPPLDFVVLRKPMIFEDNLAGFQVVAYSENSPAQVVVQIELRDLSLRGARVAACKAYVNSMAAILGRDGFTIEKVDLPDLTTWDFEKPLVLDLEFTNKDGVKIFTKKKIFFTTRGYDVTVVSNSLEDIELLYGWADQFKPAAASTDAPEQVSE